MDQALADLRELGELSRRFGFNLVECLASLSERDAPVLFCEVSDAPAMGTNYLVARFKLHELLQGALMAFRARDGNFHVAPQITLEMLNAGAVALSRVRDYVADGSVNLRDVAEAIYRAMHTALPLGGLAPTSFSRFRQSLPATAYREMSQKPPHRD
jgi:hypothetical protein